MKIYYNRYYILVYNKHAFDLPELICGMIIFLFIINKMTSIKKSGEYYNVLTKKRE